MSQTIHDIKVLKGLEGVRKRPEMYIGSVSKSQAGYFQLLKEIVDNCVDEYSSGRVKRIRISVTNLEKEGKQSFVVCDDGGGIPVEVHPDTKKTGLETVYLFLHAGGKFSTKEATRGTHGVGSSVVCALSEVFEVWTFRKKWHYLAIAKGKKKDGVRVSSRLPKEAKNWKNGTVVKYTPDYSIFANKSIKKPWLTSYLSQMVYFCPGLVVEMYWDGKKTVFRSSKGIKEYLMDIAKELEVEKVGKVFELTSKTLQVGMMWTTYTKEEQRYFVNRASTPNGTHSDLLLKTLTAVLSKFKNGKGKASYSQFGSILLINLIGNTGDSDDKIQVIFAAQTFLENFQVEQTEKTAAKTDTQSIGAFRLVNQSGIIKL
jgi:DNA gyrase subunit B